MAIFSCVYAAECTDDAGNLYVKIGKANNPVSRLPGLQVGCPFEFSLVRYWRMDSERKALAAERRIHEALSQQWLRGEWFTAVAGDEFAIRMLRTTPIEIAAAIQRRPVPTRSFDLNVYDICRKRRNAIHGRHPPVRLADA